jgi:hypothetical protein
VVAKSIEKFPVDTIGLLVFEVTVKREVDTGFSPTLVTVPLPPPPPVLDEIVTFPLAPLSVIPEPATKFTTPVLVTVTMPVLLLAFADIPAPL